MTQVAFFHALTQMVRLCVFWAIERSDNPTDTLQQDLSPKVMGDGRIGGRTLTEGRHSCHRSSTVYRFSIGLQALETPPRIHTVSSCGQGSERKNKRLPKKTASDPWPLAADTNEAGPRATASCRSEWVGLLPLVAGIGLTIGTFVAVGRADMEPWLWPASGCHSPAAGGTRWRRDARGIQLSGGV